MCIDWVSEVPGINLQDICQYEDKKNPKDKVEHIYLFDTRNQNRPEGLRIDHRLVRQRLTD
jgi:hypothetical protein